MQLTAKCSRVTVCDELGRNNIAPTKDGKGQILSSVQSKRFYFMAETLYFEQE